ncbi:MAG: serine--tRNA ligase [Rickettsiales bacterium]|jgi:seryl-tRNA synthetase|nr:serine--tRNA ligase [Rickettsiales bacterium]
MIDIKFIRENPDVVKRAAEVKGFAIDVDELLKLDVRVRELKTITEQKAAEKNRITREIPNAANRAPLIAESKKITDEIALDMAELDEKSAALNDLMLCVPQIPDTNSPVGDESANLVVGEIGEIKKYDFTPRNHWEILDMNDWWIGDKIADIAGPRSYTLTGAAAELDLALQTFVIQKLISKGFKYIHCPAIAKPDAIFNAGHFRGSDKSVMDSDVFMLNVPERALAGTSEITINSMHAGQVLDGDTLPLLYAGYSHCFRKEAGSAGRDTRGLVRVHEFHKVEQFVYCTAADAERMFDFLLENLIEVFSELEIPLRKLSVATGDMGFNKIKMTDVEAWIPGAARWLEVGSCSLIGEFQARRTNTRYRDADGKLQFCTTLNNTAIALPRALAVVLENHQNADGSVNIPRALQPLLNGRTKIFK